MPKEVRIMTPHPRVSADTQEQPEGPWCQYQKDCPDGKDWCDWPCERWFTWHDAQVAAKEREALYNWIKETFWIHDEPQYTHEEWIKRILDHLEKLRQREQPK
jgi:hypothetical protein